METSLLVLDGQIDVSVELEDLQLPANSMLVLRLTLDFAIQELKWNTILKFIGSSHYTIGFKFLNGSKDFCSWASRNAFCTLFILLEIRLFRYKSSYTSLISLSFLIS